MSKLDFAKRGHLPEGNVGSSWEIRGPSQTTSGEVGTDESDSGGWVKSVLVT